MPCLLPLVLLAVCPGCRDKAATSAGSGGAANAAWSDQYREELLTFALNSLDHLEEFESDDAAKQIPQRLEAQERLRANPSAARVETLVAAWPEPEMLRQVVDRLNRWVRTQPPPADWKLDPMAAVLPKPLADLSPVVDLDKMEFSRFDGYVLREAVWMRDVGRWARGDALDDLERAKSLFDWTVRNIQLEPNNPDRVPLFPWETLLFGSGTSTERAWVFILLARQLGIDAAMLAVGEPAGPAEKAGDASAAPAAKTDAPEGATHSWCVAVLIEGQAYLFEPLLGLPIPAPGGIKLDASGQLMIQPATLAQAVADDKVLRQLDVDLAHAYGAKSSDLKHVTVMLEASPTYLARRMKLLESRLAGTQKMVLTTSPTAQAERWKALAPVTGVRLWNAPFETIERRSQLAPEAVQSRLRALLPFFAMQPNAPLYRGRVLQLKGRFTGDGGAVSCYQMARPSQQELAISSIHPLEKFFYQQGKQDASYWLGLIAYQRGNYEAAIDSLFTRTLRAAPDSPWTSGAKYNLGRTCEARGDLDGAILQYESDVTAPGYLGDLLRAKWLRSLLEEKKNEKPPAG